ncbi:SICAvar, type I (fragment), partial [Plasmodium knowlesi strain H]
SFRQTMGCFLLHAYAKHMKEKATCLIDDGIKKAFEIWEDPNTKGANCKGSNGKEHCVPCQWKEDEYEKCQISTNGTPGQKEEVEKKLKTFVNDNDTHIQTMTKQVNKVEKLCDQVKCVTTRWIKEGNGGTKGTRDWGDVWNKVKEQIPILGEALQGATTTKKDDFGTYCNGLKKDSEGKDACLLIAAGLKNLYDIQDSTNPVKASFERTMQCVLLNAIADKLQHDSNFPCKDEKKTKEGIDWAFTTQNDAIRTATKCQNNDKCFKCERYKDIFKDCTVNTDVKVKEKVEGMLKDEALTTASTSPLTTSSLIKTIYVGTNGTTTNTTKCWYHYQHYKMLVPVLPLPPLPNVGTNGTNGTTIVVVLTQNVGTNDTNTRCWL